MFKKDDRLAILQNLIKQRIINPHLIINRKTVQDHHIKPLRRYHHPKGLDQGVKVREEGRGGEGEGAICGGGG